MSLYQLDRASHSSIVATGEAGANEGRTPSAPVGALSTAGADWTPDGERVAERRIERGELRVGCDAERVERL